MPAQSIYILRLFMKNGLTVVYNFTDPGRAVAAKEVCAKAMYASREAPKQPRTAANPGAEAWVPPQICNFIDDASREAHWDGAQMIGVQMADMVEDLEMNLRVEILGKRATQDLLLRAGEVQPPAPDGVVHTLYPPTEAPAAPPTSSIGRFAI